MKAYTNSRIIEVINDHIHSERDREIMRLRFVDGLTYSAISDRLQERLGFPLTARRISTIVSTNAAAIEKFL